MLRRRRVSPLPACLDCGSAKGTTILPHGRLCLGCRRRRHYHQMPCPGCGLNRPLAYRRPCVETGAGALEDVCAACAGVTGMDSIFACRECGSEEHPYSYSRCARCYIRQILTPALSDPTTGAIHTALVPLFETLMSSRRPQTTLWWLTKPGTVAASVLNDLATGRLPISQDTFRELLPIDRRHGYLRELLTTTGVLPPYAATIERINPWLTDLLAEHLPAHAEVLNRYARWHVLRRMRNHFAAGTLTSSIVNGGRAQILAASRIMHWAADEHAVTITALTQTQLEHYISSRPRGAGSLTSFLIWLQTSRTNTHLALKAPTTGLPEVTMSEEARWRGVELLLHDTTINSYSRVAGLFLLLYAQPLNKILRMTRDQITEHPDGRVSVTFDTVPIEQPPGVSAVLLTHLRGYQAASYPDPDTDWLFPGRLPGRSVHTESVRRTLVSHNIHPRKSRSTALFALAAQIPTPILAELLGISRGTATRWAALAARDWSDYTVHRRPEQ